MFTSEDDLCQDLQSEVTLQVQGAVDEDQTRLMYQAELFNAIFDGNLQDELDEIGANVLVTTGLEAFG